MFKCLITSAGANDGKSTIAKRLSSESDQKALLLDFDVRESLRIGQGVGIVEYMLNDAAIDDCIVEEGNYSVFLPGRRKRREFDLVFNAEKFESLLKELEKRYDVLYIDTPPLGFISDAKSLIPYCDRIVLVHSNARRGVCLIDSEVEKYGLPVVLVDNFYGT